MNPSPFSNFQQHFVQVSPEPIEGYWSTLDLQPDLFAPQSFSVGVVFQTSDNKIHCRLLKDLVKLDYIYGHDFPKSIVGEMLLHAEEILKQAEKNRFSLEAIDFYTNNLRLSKSMFSSGKTVEDIINRLYKNLVVLEPHFGLDKSVLEIKEIGND